MGGRGTYSTGNNVPFRYKTVGNMCGVKVIAKMDSTQTPNLPYESHTSSAYIKLDNNGTFSQYREFHNDKTAIIDIDYGRDNNKVSLHAHDYVNGERQKSRPLTSVEYAKYKKYFKGVNKNDRM